MKSGKRPTKNQKLLMKQANLDPDSWLVVKNLLNQLHIVNRTTGKIEILTY
ncbi:Transposase [Mesobacillus thioparans]